MKNAFYISILLAVFSSNPFLSYGGNGREAPTNKKEKVVSTFEIQSFRISKDGLVSWTAKNENGSLPYLVEQFIYDQWVKIGEISGIGTPSPNSYSVPVAFHSGENKFRVRQKGYDKTSRFSDAISYYAKKDEITYSVTNKNRTIEFSDDTYYIVYNPFGEIIKQGNSSIVDISNFKKGYYCLIYDNKLGGFKKKKVLFKNTFCPIVINSKHS